MKKYLLSLTTLLFLSVHVRAQDTIPHLSGEVNISISRGTIECDLTLSNIPRIADYYIRLNSGMNIRYIKNANGTQPLEYDKSPYDSLSYGESSAYFLSAYNDAGKFLPRAIHMNYVGMYPVVKDTGSVQDWKGNIAFNGITLRTDGTQSAWYPVLYDVKKDRKYDKVTYDIRVNCLDCKVIYVNGSQPVTGTHTVVKSDHPQDLTVFAGNYESALVNGNYFLNTGMDKAKLLSVEQSIQSCKDYYEKSLQIAYKGNAVYIQTTPVSKYNSWMFATYPTIVNIGFEESSMIRFVERNNGTDFKMFMAHELGHYYFGTYRTFNSEMGDMLQEGFSEFLSLHYTTKMISDSLFRVKLETKLKAMRNRNFMPTPFASVKSKNDYANRELYVYYYAPLIFTAIEKEIGEAKMFDWIKLLLQAPAAFTNEAFMEQTLHAAVKDDRLFGLLREKYFVSNKALDHVAEALSISDTKPANKKDNNTSVTKTVYYFFFSKPMTDAGSPENHVVKYSEIQSFTGTDEAMSAMANAKFKKLKEQCENEAGCSGDFNTYETLDDAKAALERWKKRFVDNKAYVMKTFSF